MKKSLTNIDDLIFDYLSNNLSEDNKLKVEELLKQSEEFRLCKQNLEAIWNGSSGIANSFDSKFQYYKLKNRIKKEDKEEKLKLQIRRIRPFLRIAVSLIIVFGVSYISYFIGLKADRKGHVVSVSCAAGERSSVVLPDGSTVKLNSESSIAYNTEFIKKTRDVYLKGEAYFHVHANKQNPFNVFAKNIKVTATGTKFNVNAYENEPCVETCLMDGIVAVREENNSYKLKPGEVLSINNDTKQWTKRNFVNDDLYIGWKDGKLVFKNESLSSLVRKFERFYDVNIITDPEVDTIRFSGTLQYETIDELLNILKETQNIEAKKDGKSIYLTKKKKF